MLPLGARILDSGLEYGPSGSRALVARGCSAGKDYTADKIRSLLNDHLGDHAAEGVSEQVNLAQPERIEPGHVDVSPHAISTKKLELDLRLPTGFDGVYQVSQKNAIGQTQNLFMRIDGAVTAVFPRSVYVPTEAGLVPDIPPGTVFHIGPVVEQRRDKPRVRPESMVDARTSSEPAPAPLIGLASSSPTSLITDEAYRQRRVEALLSFAVEP